MNKEIAKIWTAALRSGEYGQATGVLVEINPADGEKVGYCCLGVLCDLAVKAGVPISVDGPTLCEADDPDDEEYWNGVEYDSSDALLPDSVMKWAGLRSDDGKLFGSGDGFYGNENDTLAARNDGGASFAEIAELIDTNVDAL